MYYILFVQYVCISMEVFINTRLHSIKRVHRCMVHYFFVHGCTVYLTTGQRRDVSSNLHAGICCKCTQRSFFPPSYSPIYIYTVYMYIMYCTFTKMYPYSLLHGPGYSTSLLHIHVSSLKHLF